MRDSIHCARLLAFVTGLVNQELLLQNEYLASENRILRAHLPTRLRLSNAERSTLAEIGKRLGLKALKRLLVLRNRTPSWDGTSGSLPTSLMVPDIARILADRGSNRRWKPWWYGLPVRTQAGATTAS